MNAVSIAGQQPLHSAFRVTTRGGQKLFVKWRCGTGGVTYEQYTTLMTIRIPMPPMYGRYAAGADAQCEVYAYVEGKNAQQSWPELSTAARRLVARYLASFAATLQDLDHVAARLHVRSVQIVAEILRRAEGLRSQLSARHRLWSVLEGLPRSSPQEHLCHGDLNAKNLILADTGGLVLVDWEWLAMAEPAYELKKSRATAARGYRELARIRDDYESLTGQRVAEERLLLADIFYALVQLQIACERSLPEWQQFQTRRLTRLVRRYEDVT
jgi:thiamine kinase-like enzyme